MNKYQQQAYRIIEQAEADAERKYQQAVTKTLPRQLAKTPKDEHRDEIGRRISKLKDWQQTGWAKLRTEDGQIFEYSPYLVFKVEERSREELAAWLAALIRDAADGLTTPLSNEPAAILALSEQMYISRYIRYLVGLLDGPAQAQGKGKPAPPPEELTFEGLFISPAVEPLIIRAMQEAEPEPLLNEDEAGILFGKATVAPLQALADVLFARNLVRKGITKKAAYLAICARFGFEPSSRPDKARTEGEGVYKDYLEGFRAFFLDNRPE